MGRNDLLNTDKLNYVFEDCNTHSLKETEDMYLKDFGNSIYDDYDFDENSMVIGSGSIGQVYKCYCKSKKKYIAIKVKHPDINKNVNKTVFALRIVCFILKPINIIHNICMEYINNIYLQIDYIQEAKNTIKLKENFKNEDRIIIPEVYEYSKNFIFMSYHEGKKYSEVSTKSQLIS
jgi:ubiquinone biosynthesis protein